METNGPHKDNNDPYGNYVSSSGSCTNNTAYKEKIEDTTLDTCIYGQKKPSRLAAIMGIFDYTRKILPQGQEMIENVHRKYFGTKKKKTPLNEAAAKAGYSVTSTGARVINPESSGFMQNWDCISIVALLFVATVTPYEVSFLETELNTLWAVNRCVDFVFAIDMCLSFFVMYPVKTRFGYSMETNQVKIVKNYLAGWFVPDIISLIPLDSIGLFLQDNKLKNMKGMKVIRLFRLIKLLRILRASRLFKRWETTMSISHATLSLLKFLGAVVVAGHWFGCMWALGAKNLTGPIYLNEDLETYTNLSSEQHLSWMHKHCTCVDCVGILCKVCETCLADPNDIYAAALHFSVMTLTSIGYGDVVPTYKEERFLGVIIMFLSGLLWAYIIGSACGVIANMDKHEQEFKQTIDDLNYMMKDKCIPQEMRRRLRTFFYQTKDVIRVNSYRYIVRRLSPALQGEVAVTMNSMWVRNVWYLRDAKGSTLVGFAQALESRVFAQGEVFGEEWTLYVLIRGLVGRKGRILRREAVWGEDFILDNPNLLESLRSVALTYVEVSWMHRSSLNAILEQFPEEKIRIRKAKVKVAIFRGIIVTAQRRKEEMREAKATEGLRKASIFSNRRISFSPSKNLPASKVSDELGNDPKKDFVMQGGMLKLNMDEMLEKLSEDFHAAIQEVRQDIDTVRVQLENQNNSKDALIKNPSPSSDTVRPLSPITIDDEVEPGEDLTVVSLEPP